MIVTLSGILLQTGSCWGQGQGGMGPGWGMGGTGGVGGAGLNGGLFGPSGLVSLLWVLALLSVIGIGAYLIVNRTHPRDTEADSALATLRDRYARGEIDTEEYNRRLAFLSETSQYPGVEQ